MNEISEMQRTISFVNQFYAGRQSKTLPSRPSVEEAIMTLRKRMGLHTVPKIIWVASPKALSVSEMSSLFSKKTRDSNAQQVTELFSLELPITSAIYTIRSMVGAYDRLNWIINSQSAYHRNESTYNLHVDKLIWNLYQRDIVGVTLNARKYSHLDAWKYLAQNIWSWSCAKHHVFVIERPELFQLDERNTLHSMTGPAVKFSDDFSIYSWHGTAIPGDWIENPDDLTPEIALMQSNTEQRRAACEILGWTKIIQKLGGKTIDLNPDPSIGELLELELPGSGRERFVKVRCGTGRTFAIPVPPDMQTALQAVAWTYGLSEEEYKPEVRT